MDIVIEMQEMYWTHFHEELYREYLQAEIKKMESADKQNN